MSNLKNQFLFIALMALGGYMCIKPNTSKTMALFKDKNIASNTANTDSTEKKAYPF